MEDPIWLVATFIRFIVPLTILRWPLIGILASMATDAITSSMLGLPHGGFEHYQIWDKVLDTYYLAIAAYISWSWRDKTARAVSLFAFSYRAIGVILFVATGNLSLMLLFPNFFENFFIFYLLYRKFVPKQPLFNSPYMFGAIITAILFPKLVMEYFMHIRFIRLGDILNIVGPAGINLANIFQWILYLAIPLAILYLRVRQARKV